MPTVNFLGSDFSTTAGIKSVVATPTAGSTIVVIVAQTGGSGPLTDGMVTDDNGANTYDTFTGCLKNASADELGVYIRDRSIAAVSTTFTFDPGAVTNTGGGLIVLEIVGLNQYTVTAVRQSGTQDNQAGGGTPTPVLAAAARTTNPLIGAVFNATNPAGITPRASWAEVFDGGYITPTTGLEVMTINNGETASSIAWGSTSASAFCSVVVEFVAPGGGNQVIIF